jgi:hypothetical protein
VPERLIETANHFYTDTVGDWIRIQLSNEVMRNLGIVTRFEEPLGDTASDKKWDETWQCPHAFGGIPVQCEGVVTNIYHMNRDDKGNFLSIEGLTNQQKTLCLFLKAHTMCMRLVFNKFGKTSNAPSST